MKYVKAYSIKQSILGADKPEMHYFLTKVGAQKYLDSNNYCDNMESVKISEFIIAEYKRNFGCSIFED